MQLIPLNVELMAKTVLVSIREVLFGPLMALFYFISKIRKAFSCQQQETTKFYLKKLISVSVKLFTKLLNFLAVLKLLLEGHGKYKIASKLN